MVKGEGEGRVCVSVVVEEGYIREIAGSATRSQFRNNFRPKRATHARSGTATQTQVEKTTSRSGWLLLD